MVTRKLELDLLYNNPNALIKLDLRDAGTVVGFVTQEFTIGASAEYNTSMMSQALDKVNGAIATGTIAMNRMIEFFGGSGIVQRRVGNLSDTVATYGGTSKPTFSVNIVLISYSKKKSNILNDIRKLQKAMYPTSDGIAGINVALKAPLGYKASARGAGSSLARDGTVVVEIGKWFYAPGQLIKNVTATMSKEVISNGSPLYANVTIEFEPWRQVTADEIIKFFKV